VVTLAERTRRRVSLRLLPFLFLLYIVAYLDRANVAFAKISLERDLGFAANVFGFGAGIFFVGYFILEIPGALIVERFGARRWMARILVTWGIAASLVGLVRTPAQFYAARFFLGLAEAGFFPGLLVYLTHWFPERDRARALAGFITAIPVSLMAGAPISAMLLKLDWLGLAGWRWMFILEGIPAVVCGLVAWFYLTDRPRHARWLAPEEREWLEGELQREREAKRGVAPIRALEGLRQRGVLLLALALCLGNAGSYTFGFWLPSTIARTSGLSEIRSTLISALPYVLGLGSILLSGWSSDRTGERKLHTVVSLGLAALFFSLSAVPGQPFVLVLVWLCLTAGAIYGFPPPFWVLPSLSLGEAAAAASFGLINSIGNLGGLLGSSVVGSLEAAGYSRGTAVLFQSACFLSAAGLVLLVPVRRPRPREAQDRVAIQPVEGR
jgi:ACS family tartrate transporter-like MFS transporter